MDCKLFHIKGIFNGIVQPKIIYFIVHSIHFFFPPTVKQNKMLGRMSFPTKLDI